jgi:ABC-2 type transport system permease protein
MPRWLQVISRFNPLSYLVDALRSLMVVGGQSSFGLGQDIGVLLMATAAIVALASRLYPRLAV